MLGLPNAGGSSLCSEALSFEMLARAFGARLEMTEMELRYTPGSQITDSVSYTHLRAHETV